MAISFIEREEDLQQLKKGFYNHIVIDAKKIEYLNDRIKFKNAIEVLDVVNTINWANQFYKDVNSKIRIPTEIHYKCIDSGFSDKPFTTEQLIEYYKTSVLIEDFFMAILKFKELDNYAPYELEFVLFGLSYEEQGYLSKEQEEQLHETYGGLYSDVRMKKIDVNVFVGKMKIVINDLKENIVKKRLKN